MTDLNGKKVLITGAAQGIGLCTAREFAKAGCEVIMTDIAEDILKQSANEIGHLGGKVHYRVVDVSDRQSVDEMAKWVTEEIGELDILINNAGIGYHGELAETTLETWRRLVEINLMGPLHNIYAFLPSMIERRSGHIVNVSSGQAFFRLPTWGAYASIKAALGAMSEILHFELRKHKVHVTTVYPFMVNTGFYDDVEAKTFGAKMSMKLLPYYSSTPEKVGRIIFDAVRRRKKVEKVSIINDVGFYARVIPFANSIIARTSNFFLADRA
ncbi:MAG: SDR family oxidoreductase [Deltaproteobacteria bacterium]|nr:SDR family oxidoreductase [Deltaproteobacteria bacterium]